MSYYTADLYNQPEKFGLTIFGEAEDVNASYSFDMFVVWQDSDGKLYWASDTGCSCPSPFEDFRELTDATTGTAPECQAALDEWSRDYSAPGKAASTVDLLAKLATL